MSGCRENSGLPLLVQERITYHQHAFDLGVNPAEILYLEGLAPQRMRRLKQGLKQRNVLCLNKWRGNQITHFVNSGQFLMHPSAPFLHQTLYKCPRLIHSYITLCILIIHVFNQRFLLVFKNYKNLFWEQF